jgi:hypothetical protein
MNRKMLSNDPQNVNKNVWYYETDKGINVYIRDSQTRVVQDTIIPWRMLKSTMMRKLLGETKL